MPCRPAWPAPPLHHEHQNHGHLRPPGGPVPVQRDDAAAGDRGLAARPVRRAGDAARRRAADQRDHGHGADPLPRGQQRRRAEPGGQASRAGAEPGRRPAAQLLGGPPRAGAADAAVRGGRAAHRGPGARVRRAQREPGLAARRPGHADAGRQTQGHRRRAGARAHAVEPRRAECARPGAGGPLDRGRHQACARHARGQDHRRPGPGRQRGAGPGTAAGARRGPLASCSARCRPPTWPCRPAAWWRRKVAAC